MRMGKARKACLQDAPMPVPITGEPDAGVPVRIDDDQPSSRAKHPRRFGERQSDLGHIEIDLDGGDEVECGCRKLQVRGAASPEVEPIQDLLTCRMLAGSGQHVGTEVNARDLSARADFAGKLAGKEAQAAADVEPAFARSCGDSASGDRTLLDDLGRRIGPHHPRSLDGSECLYGHALLQNRGAARAEIHANGFLTSLGYSGAAILSGKALSPSRAATIRSTAAFSIR